MTIDKPPIQKVYWQDVRAQVAELQPEFARLADELDPGKEFPLYKVSYPYGSIIVEDGVCYYPLSDGEYVTIQDPRLPETMRSDLSYNGVAIPVGIIVNNSFEVLIKKPNNQALP